jgi:hypothetical protein
MVRTLFTRSTGAAGPGPMRVLVGSGGREQAIAWACRHHGHDVRLAADLGDASTDDTDLVFPGPEAALVAGVADECARAASRASGRPRSSRDSSRRRVRPRAGDELGIPGPAFARSTTPTRARRWWRELGARSSSSSTASPPARASPCPTARRDDRGDRRRRADGPFLLEERMRGPGVLAARPVRRRTCGRPAARPGPQAHRRGRHRPEHRRHGGLRARTGALRRRRAGGRRSSSRCSTTSRGGHAVRRRDLRRADAHRDGPRLIEYNVRFGDPEAQAVLPLVETDIAELALRPRAATLDELPLVVRAQAASRWSRRRPATRRRRRRRAITDDMVSGGGSVSTAPRRCASTPGSTPTGPSRRGRVLAVTGVGDDLAEAPAPPTTTSIADPGSRVCRCAATSAGVPSVPSSRRTPAAGVDIDEGTRAVAEMKAAVEATHDNGVCSRGSAAFGGVFSAKAITELDDPVLVASTDGVGTKVELAARLGGSRGRRRTSSTTASTTCSCSRPGRCSSSTTSPPVLDADMVAEVVRGMADACRAAGCALLGGETAEMPGVYQPGAFDIAGTLVGWPSAHAAPPARRGRRRRADRRRLERAAHQRLLTAAQGVRLDPDGRRPRRHRPCSATRCSSRTARTSTCCAPRSTPGWSRRSRTSPAAASPRTCPRAARRGRRPNRARLVAGVAAVPSSCAN